MEWAAAFERRSKVPCLRHSLIFKIVLLECSFHVGGLISVKFIPSFIKE